jgi:energy-converting hydrogenase Eha subunit G
MDTAFLLRLADTVFTAILLLIAALGVVLAWALGLLPALNVALLVVAAAAPLLYSSPSR